MILLTSSIATVADNLYKEFLADKGYKSVLFIETAAELDTPEDSDWKREDLESLERQGYNVETYTITNKTRDEIASKIDEHDILYMCGGNTFYLLQQLQKTDALSLIKEKVTGGKTYIGTSAGSIVATKDIAPTEKLDSLEAAPDLKGTQGLGIVDFILMPHWGSEHFRDLYLNQRLEKSYDDTNQKYIFLNDNQYIHVGENGYIKIIDVRDQVLK